MGFFSEIAKIFSFEKRDYYVPQQPPIEERQSQPLSLMFGGSSTYTNEKAMKLSTVYCAVEQISDAVASLDLSPYKVDRYGHRSKHLKHPLYHILNCEPNARMTRFTFIKTLVTSMLLRGNGYAWIQRNDKGEPIALHYIPSEYVTIVPPTNITEPIKYSVTGFDGFVNHTDMIHLINFSYDGVYGMSTLAHAAVTLGIATEAELQAQGFFRGGNNLAGVLTVQTQTLTDKMKKDIYDSWRKSFNAHEGGQPSGLAVLPGNMQYQPISVKPNEAQLLESRAFSIPEICRFFKIAPVKCFDYSKSSYNTIEAVNISFLTDTISPLLSKIESEFERKLCPSNTHLNIDIKFDVSQLLRADIKSQADYNSKMFSIGALSVNEIRKSIDMPRVEEGDKLFVPVNLQTLERAVSANPADSQTIKEALNEPTEEPVEEQNPDEK